MFGECMSVELKKQLEKVVLESLADKSLFGLNDFGHFVEENKKIIGFFYKQGIITNESFEQAIEHSLMNTAKRIYRLIQEKVRNGEELDIGYYYPEFLAYAIKEGVFSGKEIQKIPFKPYYKNLEDFIKQEREDGLLEHLREKFLDSKTYATHKEIDDSGFNFPM